MDPESILTHLWGGNFSLRRSDCLAIRLRRPGFAQRERYHSDRELGLRCKQHGLVGVFDRSLRATHLHERDRAAFLQDSRSQGSSLARLHQLHSETLGPLHLATLAAGLPFPLRWLVTACRLPAVERVVETGLLGVNHLASAAGASETELATGKLLRRIEQTTRRALGRSKQIGNSEQLGERERVLPPRLKRLGTTARSARSSQNDVRRPAGNRTAAAVRRLSFARWSVAESECGKPSRLVPLPSSWQQVARRRIVLRHPRP